jgi:hypothetical protein
MPCPDHRNYLLSNDLSIRNFSSHHKPDFRPSPEGRPGPETPQLPEPFEHSGPIPRPEEQNGGGSRTFAGVASNENYRRGRRIRMNSRMGLNYKKGV